MGKTQSTTANWSIDDWAYGTGQNAVSIDEVIHETSQIPEKYFGGKVIQNDASMHQMQNDLLAFDETVKNIFRKKKNKQLKINVPPEDQYYHEGRQSGPVAQPPIDSKYYSNHSQSKLTNGYGPPPPTSISISINDSSKNAATNSNRLSWRCVNCAIENHATERLCRRCGQGQTRL